ncbi:HNH endonuclease [Haloprofundus halobius]|uniref:HNH endonuclease n=1 Tax=Haloprofundus halobius TaxID=2876194 RepID=UPI001CCB5D95|nr:HNH endonuclease [Haloprofundus halobius]
MSSRSQVPQAVREQILQEVGYCCELCPARGTQVGGDANLHLHHRESPLVGGSHDRENLVVLCADCHHHHHSGRTDSDDIETNLETVDIDPTPADFRLLSAIEQIAPATTGELAEEAGISDVHALRRLYALAAASVVCKTADREWDLAERVDEPLRGQLPDDPEQAARHARDSVIKRMNDHGLSIAEIAEIVGLSERTIPIAINRARAFDPPLPPADGASEPDIADLARRVASLERQLN